MKRITDWTSVSLIEAAFRQPDGQGLLDVYAALHRTAGRHGGARTFLKERLGRQDYCWDGSVRNWVWERRTPGPKWRAFASKRGLSLEVEARASGAAVRAAFDDFLRETGAAP